LSEFKKQRSESKKLKGKMNNAENIINSFLPFTFYYYFVIGIEGISIN